MGVSMLPCSTICPPTVSTASITAAWTTLRRGFVTRSPRSPFPGTRSGAAAATARKQVAMVQMATDAGLAPAPPRPVCHTMIPSPRPTMSTAAATQRITARPGWYTAASNSTQPKSRSMPT